MKSILFLSLIAVSGACVDQTDDADLETTNPTTDDVPRLAANGLTPSQIIYTTLDQGPLNATTTASIHVSAPGFLSYLVSCAFSTGQSLTVNGTTYPGSIGLAPGWSTGAISASDRRWISACMLARANSIGNSLTISLRGNNSALALSSTEIANGDARNEGSYYGDIFVSGMNQRACGDLATINRTLGTFKGRVCAAQQDEVTACGYRYDGACASTCVSTGGATPIYTSCLDTTGVTWNEVIKVNL
jgi:hypothetical protein